MSTTGRILALALLGALSLAGCSSAGTASASHTSAIATVPTDAVPTDAIPTDAIPTDAIPTDAIPTDAISAHTVEVSCSTATLDDLAEVGAGLKTPKGRGLFQGARIELATPIDGFRTIIAAKINIGSQPIGIWAMGDGSSLDAVNAAAQRYTRWGELTEAGSQIAADRVALRATPEYRAAARCVAEA